MLINNDVSHQTVGILLKYLMNNLESIGTQSKIEGALTLKLFKLSFMAVNQFIELNEPVLVPYLSKLIINSFAYAARAEDPTIYYQVLRALFRYVSRTRSWPFTLTDSFPFSGRLVEGDSKLCTKRYYPSSRKCLRRSISCFDTLNRQRGTCSSSSASRCQYD